MMILVDARMPYKCGVYLPDKSDATTIQAFDNFHTKAEMATGKKIHQLWTD